MVKKKVDERIRTLIENGVQTRHRSLFVMVGDHGKDQVANLHYILSKAQVAKRPSVLWCYKKELAFSSHKKKRMKQMHKKKQLGLIDAERIEEDPFELFLASTDIRYAYYHETDKILGNTFGMCVLQDFEALTPNLLARTIETVQGGGIVIILLGTMNSLKQLYTMSMDVHNRYRTEGRHEAVARFNERFLLSLTGCDSCLVVDDQLNVLPVSSHAKDIRPINNETVDGLRTPEQIELEKLKQQLSATASNAANGSKEKQLAALVNVAKTLDQAKVLQSTMQILAEQNHTMKMTVSLTAARGRGKSAAMGLSLAAAIAQGFGNVFVTAPSPENLKTFFEFVFRGLDALGYAEHMDYDVVQSTHEEFNKAVVRVNIFKSGHRQTILYIHPQDSQLLSQAELVVIDEAAAIPLPLVQALCSGPQLVFLASTINGYEGTGRSLSLKLIQQLKSRSGMAGSRTLRELSLSEPIRYGVNDPVEKWLNALLCLDVANIITKPSLGGAFPAPEKCELYAVNRDTLFSHHRASETFLQKMMALYVASHYKNTPNDLQLMSDAPAHRLYVLLPPVDENKATSLPEILCVLQVCFEGEISKQVVLQSLAQGKRASGDLIPWTMSQQFQDDDFATLSGARVVRVAVHPELQGMGYGSRAIQLLESFFRGTLYTGDDSDPNSLDEDDVTRDASSITSTATATESQLQSEVIKPRSNLKPLLVKLSDRRPILLDWLGVSFGMTKQLFKFWNRLSFLPVYLRQTTNDITGEHTAIMLKRLDSANAQPWLEAFNEDFRRRFVSLLSYQFRSFPMSLCLDILSGKIKQSAATCIDEAELAHQITVYDLKRLESYASNTIDYHMIMDLIPTMAKHYFLDQLPKLPNVEELSLSPVQSAILLALGLQHRIIEDVEKEINLPVSQCLAMFIKTARKFARYYREMHMRKLDPNSQKANTNDSVEVDAEIIDDDGQPTRDKLLTPGSSPAEAGSKKRSLEQVSQWQAAPDLEEDLDEAAKEARNRLREKQKELINSLDLNQFAIGGNDKEWDAELKKKGKNLSNSILNIGVKKAPSQGGADEKKTKPLAKALFDKKDAELIKKAKKSKYAK